MPIDPLAGIDLGSGDPKLDNRVKNTTRLQSTFGDIYDESFLSNSYDLEADWMPKLKEYNKATEKQRNRFVSPESEIGAYDDLIESMDRSVNPKVRQSAAQTRLEKWDTLAGLAAKGIGLTQVGVQSGVATIANKIAGAFGIGRDLSELALGDDNVINDFYEKAEAIFNEVAEGRFADPGVEALAEEQRDTVAGKVTGVAGQVLTEAGTFAVGGTAIGSSSMFTSFFNEGAKEYERELGERANPEDRLRFAGIYAAAATASETVLGIERVAGKIISEMPPQAKRKALGWLAARMGMEGATEVSQQWLLEFMLSTEFDREGEYLTPETLETFLLGAVGGGIGGGAAVGASFANQAVKSEAGSQEVWDTMRNVYEDEIQFIENEGGIDNRLDELMKEAYREPTKENREAVSKFIENYSEPDGFEQLELNFEEQAEFNRTTPEAPEIFQSVANLQQLFLPSPTRDAAQRIGETVLEPGTEPVIAEQSDLLENIRKKTETPTQRKNREIRFLKKKFQLAFKDMKKGFREEIKGLKKKAKIDEKTAVKERQAMIVNHVKNVNKLMKSLPVAVRGEWSAFVAAADKRTVNGQIAQIEQLEAKVRKTFDNYQVKQIKTATRKLLKPVATGRKSALKKKAKEVGFVRAQVARDALNATKQNREDLMAKAMTFARKQAEINGDSIEDAERIVETTFAMVADAQTPADWRKAFKFIKELRSDIKAADMAHVAKRRKTQEELLETTLDEMRPKEIVHGTQRLREIKGDKNGVINVLTEKGAHFRQWMMDAHDGMEHLIENLHGKRKKGEKRKAFTGALHDATTKRLNQARRTFDINARNHLGELRKAVDIIADNNGWTKAQALKELRSWQRDPVTYGKDDAIIYSSELDAKGNPMKPKAVRLTKMEMISLWMWRQDRTLDSNFDAMNWTEEMNDRLEKHLGEDGKTLAKAYLARYKEMGRRMNDALFDNEGYKLLLIENYSPKRVVRDKQDVDSLDNVNPMDDYAARLEKTQAMKERTDKSSPLAPQDASTMFAQEMAFNEHYAAYGSVLRDMRELTQNPTFRNTMKAANREPVLKMLDDHIKDIANMGVGYTKGIRWLNTLLSNFSVAKIGINPGSSFKQLGSIPSDVFDVGPVNWVKYQAQFASDVKGNWAKLYNTSFIQDRIDSSFDPLIRDGQTLRDINKQMQDPSVFGKDYKSKLMVLTRGADVAAVITAGFPRYQLTYDQNVDKVGHEKATEMAELAFQETMSRVQQDAHVLNKSFYQRNAALRMFTMFMSAPIQYQREVNRALRTLVSGNASKWDAAKTFTMYHVVLPQLFALMGDFVGWIWGDDDQHEKLKERHIEALIMGNFNTVMMLGGAIANVVDLAVGEYNNFQFKIPGVDQLYDLSTAVAESLGAGDKTDEERIDSALEATALAIESFTGTPVQNITQIIDLTETAIEEQTAEAWTRAVFKHTDYGVGISTKGKKKKKKLIVE